MGRRKQVEIGLLSSLSPSCQVAVARSTTGLRSFLYITFSLQVLVRTPPLPLRSYRQWWRPTLTSSEGTSCAMPAPHTLPHLLLLLRIPSVSYWDTAWQSQSTFLFNNTLASGLEPWANKWVCFTIQLIGDPAQMCYWSLLQIIVILHIHALHKCTHTDLGTKWKGTLHEIITISIIKSRYQRFFHKSDCKCFDTDLKLQFGQTPGNFAFSYARPWEDDKR